ncbi:MAG: nucleotidyltransferase family protein [Acidimicrobiia bacterium]
MDLSRPLAVITPTLDAPVLAVLARSGLSLSGREVHRLAGTGSASGVHKVLRRLVRQGIVIADERPSETLYELNRQHLAAEAVDVIVRIPETLINHLRRILRSWVPAPRHASVFGSFARGESSVDSDVDLLLIRPGRAAGSWEHAVVALQDQVRAMTGNAVEVLEWSVSELRAQRRTNLLRELLSDSILLAGPPLERLVNTAQ